ncbi:MAG: tryptophan--tRNA ligase, partial [Fulvimarina sp.]|nr:tryptophan--tRNA ligase [Fulvimarina sp.]
SKMSKSDPSAASRIAMTDNSDAIAHKIRKAKTDPEPLPSGPEGLKKRPEAANLVGIYAALAERGKAEVLAEFGGRQFSEFKAVLAELAVEKLAPINAEMRRLTDDPGHIDAVLKDGGERAGAIAEKTMADVKEIVGFLR